MNKSYIIASLILILSVLWMASGMVFDNPKNIVKANKNKEKALQTVEVLESRAILVEQNIQLTGQTASSRHVDVKSEIMGKVVEILVDKGGFVKENQIIAKLALDDRQANVSMARQGVKRYKIEYNAAQGLMDKGFSSKVKLAQAQSNLETAKAALEHAEVNLKNINIRAPFSGILETRPIEVGTYLGVSSLVGTVVDLNPMHIVAFVSENYITLLNLGSQVTAVLPDDAVIEGNIIYIAKTANKITRTFRIEIEVDNTDGHIVEGLTTRLAISLEQKKAHMIPSSILTLSDKGFVGIKAINDNNLVVFYPVKIISDGQIEMSVSGISDKQPLPDKMDLIVVGQDFVIPNQKVQPIRKNIENNKVK